MMLASAWVGHPPGLYVLFMTELWERFSFYGMGAPALRMPRLRTATLTPPRRPSGALLVLYLNSGTLAPSRFVRAETAPLISPPPPLCATPPLSPFRLPPLLRSPVLAVRNVWRVACANAGRRPADGGGGAGTIISALGRVRLPRLRLAVRAPSPPPLIPSSPTYVPTATIRLGGGVIADVILGPRNTLLLGGTMMALGHLMQMIEVLFLPGLALVALGNGLFKPNISAQVANRPPLSESSPAPVSAPISTLISALISAPISAIDIGHSRRQVSSLYAGKYSALRERGFAIFYSGINLGSFFAPIACGAVAQSFSFSAAFGLAGVSTRPPIVHVSPLSTVHVAQLGMLVAMATYLLGSKHLPDRTEAWPDHAAGMRARL